MVGVSAWRLPSILKPPAGGFTGARPPMIWAIVGLMANKLTRSNRQISPGNRFPALPGKSGNKTAAINFRYLGVDFVFMALDLNGVGLIFSVECALTSKKYKERKAQGQYWGV
jgi:hypothetical protein